MNDYDENQLYLSLLADIDDEARRQRQLGVFGALMFVGADHSRRQRSERRHARHTYLVRVPWQALYSAQKDRAFVTTMGVDTLTLKCTVVAQSMKLLHDLVDFV
ncbi:hypothetical protein EDD22DRAFT_868630 [Suillus occidentalis]|nr:hypothetical protein EDD22DRAFT_868630 [Suillus occidentalis]